MQFYSNSRPEKTRAGLHEIDDDDAEEAESAAQITSYDEDEDEGDDDEDDQQARALPQGRRRKVRMVTDLDGNLVEEYYLDSENDDDNCEECSEEDSNGRRESQGVGGTSDAKQHQGTVVKHRIRRPVLAKR